MGEIENWSDDEIGRRLLATREVVTIGPIPLAEELFRRLTEARTELADTKRRLDGLRESVMLEIALCYNCRGGQEPTRLMGVIQPCEYCVRRQAALDASAEKGTDDAKV